MGIIHRLILAGSATLLAGACGGIGPGDYVVYRIAFQTPTQSEGCYPNGQVPVNEEQDTSDEYIADTWILYVGPENRVYLDLGSTTLGGEESGDGYTFAGQRTDVTVVTDVDGMTERTETRTTSTNVTLTRDGEVVEGVMTQTEELRCTGTGCGEDLSCTTTTNFVGGEVKDVHIQHEV